MVVWVGVVVVLVLVLVVVMVVAVMVMMIARVSRGGRCICFPVRLAQR
jgi:hypothetical protein